MRQQSRGRRLPLTEAWRLHPLLVEDLLRAHQRPKLDRYGDVLFLVVRSARHTFDRIEKLTPGDVVVRALSRRAPAPPRPR
ncbi:hypothetical protein GCM10027406_05240 [Leifsonia lichenia]